MNTDVSVIIPVYNGEKFIVRAIDSVINQSLQAAEIIVVNDGSTDNTDFLLKKFGSLIKVITTSNAGVASARNVGIQASISEYIAFLDADDIWYKDKLKIQLDFFAKFPSVGFSCSDFYFVSDESNSKSNLFKKFANNKNYNFDSPLKTLPLLRLLETNFVGSCSNVIFKRNLINTVGLFDASLKQAEDFDIWLKFSFITDFILISAPLVEKFTHDSNLTNDFLETLMYREAVLARLGNNHATSENLLPHINKYNLELTKCRYRIASLAFRNDFKMLATKYLLKGFRTMPIIDSILFSFNSISKKLRGS